MPRAFRFGVSIAGAASRTEWRSKAQTAESMGFDTVLVADHLVDGMLMPLSTLVVAAEATDHVRVGTLVLNNDLRHPVVLAREAATVDLLTEGRLELGLGAGHMKAEYDEAGITFDPPSLRVARMAEAAEVIRRLWRGEEVVFSGQHYRIDGHRCFPVPLQQPLPLLIGGNGYRVLTTAARLADIVGFTGFSQVEGERGVKPTHFTTDGLAAQVQWVRAAAGHRFEKIELSTLVQDVMLTDNRRSAAEKIQARLPSVPDAEILSSPYLLIGTADQIAAQLQEQRDGVGISYITVFEKDLNATARVIELIRR